VPEFFKAIGAARFGVMAGVAAVLTAFFLYIAGAITEPPKTILYAGLEARCSNTMPRVMAARSWCLPTR
jgi:flagellar M-ring protein FliF